MTGDIDLDHVSLAVERWADAWPVYAARLGGVWKSGGEGPGFAPAQLRYANGMKLELIQPNAVDQNDFLRRFLDRHGVGPHHLTYKVSSLDAMLARAEAAGIQPVNVDRSDPEWLEAFLHPRDALGILIQIAEAPGSEWVTEPPSDFPHETAQPAALVRVTHAVTDLDDGLRLFRDVLGGNAVGEGSDSGSHWIELAWPGPGRVRLLTPTSSASSLHAWLDGRAGRLHHLAFSVTNAISVPDHACGVRLLLEPMGT